MMDAEELMSDLRRIGSQVDPVPELVIDNVCAALLTRRLDEELAELLLDSAVESGQVRGGQERRRLLSFQLASSRSRFSRVRGRSGVASWSRRRNGR